MKNTKRKSKLYLLISLILVVVGVIGASLVQTSGGEVEVKEIKWETPSGHTMSAFLFTPEGVSEDNPAPGIVTSHGWYNNKEMQDMNFVEYSRRGYVVMSIDMYGHGESEAVSPDEWPERGTGMYDAVELMTDLPYIDTSRIGITGHSNGARAANWSIDLDNEKENQLIDSVLLVANDADYINPDTEEYYNKYGNRDVGIVAAQYDEFFFRTENPDGTMTAPRDFIDTDNAQSFLHFGESPENIESTRSSYEMYEKEINGESTTRVIYNPSQTHPWNHFSGHVATQSINFFDETLGNPEDIPAEEQVWQFKEFFNLLGLIGFGMFLVSFTKVLLFTGPFSELRAPQVPSPAELATKKQKAWFWGGLVASAVFSGVSYIALFNWTAVNRPDFFPQAYTFYVGTWAALNGLFAILLVFLSRKFTDSECKSKLKDVGVSISLRTLGKTALLALIVSAAAFGLVFVSDYLFNTDFRIWFLAVTDFTPDKLIIGIKYLPFFLIYFVANSIVVNSFNYYRNGKKEWVNTALLALFNALGPIVVLAIQYTTFFVTGHVFFENVSAIVGIWLISFLVILPVAAIISRKIFKASLNPYLGGIIIAIVVTLISVSNTLTQLPN
ncbi:alpha/beta hydrolase family protein [Salimicrobium album]|uniref:Alpha/beta hydrolase family protein n=1 Tax=Salimicrobium album TaxID=50717 RepID=A0A1H3GZQ5_9BACI|nr:CocE/NonD family hydrolase [Salimicrobium album]SDY08607.1 Alpha/beta hydrolase family protein [Salimicrobium album]